MFCDRGANVLHTWCERGADVLLPSQVRDSKNLLVEHLDEAPPIVSNAGMASRIKHYYRTKPDQPPPTIPADTLNDGKPVALDLQQESPFFDDLPEGQQVLSSHRIASHLIASHLITSHRMLSQRGETK